MQHRRHPVHAAQAALGALAIALALACGSAAAASPAGSDGMRPAGEGRLRFWGIALYDAQLWTGADFVAEQFERHPFVLELAYLRPFRGGDVADRSIDEMRKQRPIEAAQAARWQAQLRQLLPDVREGDRIAGVHRPGAGMSFFLNGKPLGEIADPDFAARFFGIWLSPATTAPELRAALLRKAVR
jgi:hypothetical protein